MKLNTKEFLAAVAAITAIPGGTFPAANLVRFVGGKLTRATFEAYGEVTLAGADDDILLDGEWLKRIQPPSDTLEITTEGERHTLRSGNLVATRQKIKDKAIDAPVPQGKGVKLTIPPEAIKAALAAASNDPSRPALNGIILDGNDSNLLVIGTNGNRLHATDLGKTDFKGKTSLGTQFAKLIDDGATITVFDNCFAVDSEGKKLILPMLNDLPPGCRQVIPKEFDAFAEISGECLRDAVGRMKALNPGGQFMKMEFTKGNLALSFNDKEVGTSEISLPCKTKGIEPFAINEQFLAAALPLCGDDLTLNTLDGNRGLTIKHNNLTIVLMGARIQ